MKFPIATALLVLLTSSQHAFAQHEHHHVSKEAAQHEQMQQNPPVDDHSNPESMKQQHHGNQHAGHEHMGGSSDTPSGSLAEGTRIWTCSMHPQIRLKKPGQCPICSMDLIPVQGHDGTGDTNDSTTLKLQESEAARLRVQTSSVQRKWVDRSTRLVGQIDFDETKVKHITAWVPGRIERLFVDYTGIEVKQGDHMVLLYSPELVSAQEELVQALRFSRSQSGSERLRRSSQQTLKAAREKLKLLGLNANQVSKIEQRGKPQNSVTIFSPIGGVVVEKHVNEGIYVNTGTRIYTIADLSTLWLNLEAYESDLPWIRYGQKVRFRAQALPGETFEGIVSFIQPFLNETTRTIRVRVNVKNTDARLKPGMFVTAHVSSKIDSNGDVVGPSFSDSYICPMHPEIVQAESGKCSICGMPLVKAETLSFIEKKDSGEPQAPLVIPSSAPLITGKRAVVYVKRAEDHSYSLREVVLGPRAGEYYVVASGLAEGELVVSKGAFKIDADLQIRGAQSMMAPEAEPPAGKMQSNHQHAGHQH